MEEKKNDITNKELLQSIHSDLRSTSARLSKIEDAIVQIAATQVRVRVLDECLQKSIQANTLFQLDVWNEFKELHKVDMQCLEARASFRERVGALEKDNVNIEQWRHEVIPKIDSNSKVRGIVEKVAMAVIVACILTAGTALWGMRTPNARLVSLEAGMAAHLESSNKIMKMLEAEHNQLDKLGIRLEKHDSDRSEAHETGD